MNETEDKKKERKKRHVSLAEKTNKIPNTLRDFKKTLFSMKKGKYG